MSFIKVNLGEDVKERQAAPEARYPLIVLDVGDKPANSGSEMLTLTIGFEGQEDKYKSFKHYITLPTEGDDDEVKKMKSLGLKRFIVAYNVEHGDDGFDQEALYGMVLDGDITQKLIETDRNGDPIDQPYEVNELRVPFLA